MILKTNSNDCDLGLILGAGYQGYQWMSERLGDLNRKWEINGGVCQNAGSPKGSKISPVTWYKEE